MKLSVSLIASLIAIAVFLFSLCLVSTIFGGAVGWVVGLIFGDLILDFMSRLGVNVVDLKMWEVGCALGFIGSFFRSNQTINRDGK